MNPIHPYPTARPELGLGDYLAALWHHRVAVVGLGVLLAVVAGLVSRALPARFESTLVVRVSPSKLTTGAAADRTFGPASLVPLLRSTTVVQEALTNSKLDQPPLALKAQGFITRHLDVAQLEGTDFVEVRVTLGDAASAARMANALGEQAFKAVREVTDGEVAGLERQLKPVVTEAEQRFQQAELALDQFRRTAQVELVKKDVDTLLTQRGDLAKLQVEIDAERARLARAERERAARSELDTLSQTIMDSPALAEAARTQADTRALLGLSLSSQRVNEVYRTIDETVAKSRAELASLESQRDRLVRSAGVGGEVLPRLTEYYNRESRLQRLQLEYDIAKQAFKDIAERYQGARLATLSRTPQLVVVDSAEPADEPVRRHTVRNAAIGLVIGMALGVLYAFVRLALPRIMEPDQPGASAAS